MKDLIKTIKSNLSPHMRQVIKDGLMIHRSLTSGIRMMPDFIIIGAQRCGTTSLYKFLTQHPCIAPAYAKEVHFFDLNFNKGTNWYKANFPSVFYKHYKKKFFGRSIITGEASPYYIFHPRVPQRILETSPQVKFIVMLRNPVDRAYSHYHHEISLGTEHLSFEGAIQKEEQRLASEKGKIIEDEYYYSFNHQHYSYVSRGIYVDQIKVWMDLFPRENFFILKSEDFYFNTATIMDDIFNFLCVEQCTLKLEKQYNSLNYKKIDPALRRYLIKYFEPYNKRLYKFLEVDFGWDD